MNLILEDGTGLETANSYASVAEADAYHDSRLHSLARTAAQTPVKERALAMATTTLDAMTAWLMVRRKRIHEGVRQTRIWVVNRRKNRSRHIGWRHGGH